ncbi:hypothetical protein [Massilia pseudoviolaceinigra]|uniref:hypothetical protein n=1 Tax=Massilia pseudoviolaceinigra TaxID=3057165 RepID=UPI00279657E8|nr:hypothetical protein [Massilia sp. CCM 9206]MDQ1924387.1 hypothetical protein [Massilia sp. CCM 9206]
MRIHLPKFTSHRIFCRIVLNRFTPNAGKDYIDVVLWRYAGNKCPADLVGNYFRRMQSGLHFVPVRVRAAAQATVAQLVRANVSKCPDDVVATLVSMNADEITLEER